MTNTSDQHPAQPISGDSIKTGNIFNSQGIAIGPHASTSYMYISVESNAFDFFTPPLESYQPPHFVVPDISYQLVNDLRERHLIILGGDSTVNKETLARHLAWRVNCGSSGSQEGCSSQQPVIDETTSMAEAQTEDSSPNATLTRTIKEWKHSGTQSIGIALQEFERGTIVILPQLLPQHINYDLRRFVHTITDLQHYVIVTVEEDALWRGACDKALLDRFWKNLQAREVYTDDYLHRVLRQKVAQSREILPQHLLVSTLKHNSLGNQPTDVIARRLKTPENIDDFVSMVCDGVKQKRQIDIAVKEYMNAAQDDLHRIRHWYYSFELREQLLTLALHFFDGLVDDQFFAAIDTLIDQAWHRREQSLLSLDYCDFDQLDKFFNYVQDRYGQAVKTKLRNQRQLLLQVAWSKHRRHILSALPVFVQFVKESVASTPHNWSLYGSVERRERLRKILSDTISDIGLCDAQLAEETLLRLAIDPHVGVQVVAAQAIARWREYSQHIKLYTLLQRWLNDPEIIKRISSITTSATSTSGEQPDDRLKATIGFLIGYATQSDIPNRVSQPLYRALEQLADDPDQYVRQSLCSVVLPLILPLHFDQVQGIVIRLTRDHDLHPAIVHSITHTYNRNPYAVDVVLRRWYKKGLRTTSGLSSNSSESLDEDQRIALLACVSMVYGRLPCTGEENILNEEQIFERLRTILMNEQSFHVRKAAMGAVIRHGRTYFTRLKDIIPSISNDEMNEILSALVEIYLDQRQGLSGGDQQVVLKGQRYPVWVHPWERPLTEVEKEMYAWMKEMDTTITQQIAYRSLFRFRREFNDEELYRVEQAKKVVEPDVDLDHLFSATMREPYMIGFHRFDFFLHHIVAWLVAPWSSSHRNIVRSLLPEALQQDAAFPDVTRILLRDFTFLPDDDIVDIAHRLRAALALSYRRKLVMIVTTATILIVFMMGVIFLALVVKLWMMLFSSSASTL